MNSETTLKLPSALPADFARRQAILLANYEAQRTLHQTRHLRRQRIRAVAESALTHALMAGLALTILSALFNLTPWDFIEAL